MGCIVKHAHYLIQRHIGPKGSRSGSTQLKCQLVENAFVNAMPFGVDVQDVWIRAMTVAAQSSPLMMRGENEVREPADTFFPISGAVAEKRDDGLAPHRR
ncbi:unspecified product [Leishmania tarentolae]|uniref:Unspecified product n=1 Tax=Leishmania tarentolae TaxID=5689 RepID=A0A640KVM7_LEITA|nr:unspecified product [Leishmania tarentolae]